MKKKIGVEDVAIFNNAKNIAQAYRNSFKKESIYKNLSEYYDLLYSAKDYREESANIKALIEKYKKSPGDKLLEIACGTGKHAHYLDKDFSVTATDINKGMLKVAKKNYPQINFEYLDMVNFDLGQKFDAITCLFSSIGYVKTYANLKKTVGNFARHLNKGGVVLIEGWHTKKTFKDGYPSMLTYTNDDTKMARLCVSKIRGMISITDMHILVAKKNKEVQYFLDEHELAMFEPEKIVSFMEAAGLKTRMLKGGLLKDRILYIGVKN